MYVVSILSIIVHANNVKYLTIHLKYFKYFKYCDVRLKRNLTVLNTIYSRISAKYLINVFSLSNFLHFNAPISRLLESFPYRLPKRNEIQIVCASRHVTFKSRLKNKRLVTTHKNWRT